MAKIRQINPDRPDLNLLSLAAQIIHDGGVVAFPTETVYGLGVDSRNPDAIHRIYDIKGRSWDKPLLVLVSDTSWIKPLTTSISDQANTLISRFWPGPLTLTFQASPAVPRELLGGGNTIGIRLPGFSIAHELTKVVGYPITAPSANRSGTPNPITAQDVAEGLSGEIDLILDGGPTGSVVPSTVVDVSTSKPRLIRSGPIPFDDILQVWRINAP